jgi:hypothetical protein
VSDSQSDVERAMWFVFEAEYEIENGRANWNRPVRETMAWHGPFRTEAEANDIYAHKARVVDLTESDL